MVIWGLEALVASHNMIEVVASYHYTTTHKQEKNEWLSIKNSFIITDGGIQWV